MFKKLTLAATAMVMTASGLAATPAAAQRYDGGQAYAYDQAYRDGYNRDDGYRDHRTYQDDRRDYRDDRRDYRNDGYYQDRRYYSRARNRCNSDRGTIIGAIGRHQGREERPDHEPRDNRLLEAAFEGQMVEVPTQVPG